MGNYKLTDYQQNLYYENVDHVWYLKVGFKTTIAVIRIKNGFEIVGTSACVNPEDFVFEIGKHFALVNALNKLDEHIGFLRQHMNIESDKSKVSNNNITINVNVLAQEKKETIKEVIKQLNNEIAKEIEKGLNDVKWN